MLALATNAYTDYVKGVPNRVRIVQQADELIFPVIVIGELLAGFRKGTRSPQNEIALRQFLQSSRSQVLPVDEDTAHHYSYVTDTLRRQGTPIPTNDIWIAALVLQHGLTLCTSDDHFRQVPGLPVC